MQGDGDLAFTTWRDDVYCEAHSSAPLTIGATTYVAGVFEAGAIRVYVGGVEVGSASGCPSPIDTTEGLVLGFDRTYGYFDGVLDDVAVYDQVLPTSRMLAHIAAVK